MRCRGCNKLLSEVESKVRNKYTGDYEDLCGDCRSVSNMAIYELSEQSTASQWTEQEWKDMLHEIRVESDDFE